MKPKCFFRGVIINTNPLPSHILVFIILKKIFFILYNIYMEPKVVNREVKMITTLKYDDGSTKTTEDFKAYSNDIDLPVFLYGKVEYKDKDGKIDEDKSSYFRETLCIGDDESSQEESDLESVSESEADSESESKDTECQTTP